ncbi:MAG: cytochrome c biogenesis protein CcsA [Planctomycetota bacterium]
MSGAVQALNVALPVLYLLAALLHGMSFGGPEAPQPVRTRRAVTAAALAAHLSLFLVHWSSSGASPFFDPWTTLSAVAFALAVLFLGTSWRVAESGAGGIVLGVVGLVQCLASAAGPMTARVAAEPANAIAFVHAITSISATGALLLSALHGTLFLIVLSRMKHHQFGPLVRRLPNLQTLARLMRRAALAGFLLLAAGVNIGIGWAHHSDAAGFSYTDPLVFSMIALWLFFGVVAFSSAIPGFTARRASIAAAVGGLVLLVASIAAVLPIASFHWGA